MTAAGEAAVRRRSLRRPSFEVDFNGTMRQVPSASGSDSDTSTEALLQVTTDAAAAAEQGGACGSPSKQQKHVCGVEQERQRHISAQEWGNMAVLVLLYAMQGIPLGLTMGAMPFLLQSKLSMTQMGLFSISGYPYSFKLLWSPIVDSVYSAGFGRRKSWIVPVQLISAALLMFSADWIQIQYEAGAVAPLTVLFFFFVLLAATQDIAVDGWALTLLPPHHIEYASTCQTLGMNTGYFMSFTIFLALSSTEFCNKYIRSNRLAGALGLQPQDFPLLTLRGYIVFWGCAFTLTTLAIALWKQETDHYTEEQERKRRKHMHKKRHKRVGAGGGSAGRASELEDGRGSGAAAAAAARDEEPSGPDWVSRRAEIVTAYQKLWQVVCLPAIWALSFLLVTYRLGVLPAESAASLKLLDKGVAKEALAALVLVQFPVELVSAVVAGRWASTHSPYQPFMAGYFVRLLMAVLLTTLARAFPPAMGGAYLTLLNTIANMGVILPKTPLYAAMDWLTFSQCHDSKGLLVKNLACPKKIRLLAGSSPCTNAGHTCSMAADGFYVVSYSMVVLGLVLGCVYMRLFPRLISLQLLHWRAKLV